LKAHDIVVLYLVVQVGVQRSGDVRVRGSPHVMASEGERQMQDARERVPHTRDEGLPELETALVLSESEAS
jgi:hypothetical protein